VFPRKEHVTAGSRCLGLHRTHVNWTLQSPSSPAHPSLHGVQENDWKTWILFSLKKTTNSSLYQLKNCFIFAYLWPIWNEVRGAVKKFPELWYSTVTLGHMTTLT